MPKVVDFVPGEKLYLLARHKAGHLMVLDCTFVGLHEGGLLVTEARDGVESIGGTAGDVFKVALEALQVAIRPAE